MIKWSMIGCGDVTEVKSGPAFNIEGRSQLSGVFSRTVDKAKDYAKRHNVPRVFGSVKELINAKGIDAVYIATPPASHTELALEVARAGKPCCIEKPIANSYAEALQITEAFRVSGAPVFVAYYRRTLPRFTAVHDWILKGKIGDVRHVHWSLAQQQSTEDIAKHYSWRTDPNHAPGGSITQASGFSVNQAGLYHVPDSVSAAWMHEANITGSAYWNFSGSETSDEIVIIGDKGQVTFSVFGDKSPQCEIVGEVLSLDIDHPKHVQKYHVESMIDHLSGKVEYSSTGESAARTAWVCDKILSKL